MQVEKFDFAIYGSGIDAAFLAAELIQRHHARVLLVRDHVNDYTLQHHHDFSVGGNCDPDTIRMAHSGLNQWHNQFTGRAGRECFDRGPISLKVSSSQNADMLHYIEGALIASDRQSERKAVREGVEYLQIRDVIAPKRRESLEFLHHAYVGVGLEVFDRSVFFEARRTKDGALILKTDREKFSASQTIVLDDDLIDAHSNSALRKVLHPIKGSKAALTPIARFTKPPALFVDSQICIRAHANNILISAPLSYEDLVHQGKKEIIDLEQLRIHAQGAFASVSTVDGAPVLELEKGKNTWLFSGGAVRTFLMPSVSDIIAGKPDHAAEQYWSNRGASGRRYGDICTPQIVGPGDKNAVV